MTLAISSTEGRRPLYVYMQVPSTDTWLTVGAYWKDRENATGRFKYAPSYEAAGHPWAIDPINLARQQAPGHVYTCNRYQGLHDVLRDACPDAWGQAVLRKLHGLPSNAPMLAYLKAASNADRWGALAVGSTAKPSIAALATPKLPKLQAVVIELQAMAARKPAVDPALRARLQQTPSLGGARPKATVQDHHGQYWLVKPLVANDTANIPMLEHFAQSWGLECGMRFAKTVYHEPGDGHAAVRVLRFDRHKSRRTLCISAASLLQVEFPGGTIPPAVPSYPRLAGQLRLIGAPAEDGIELFERMVFNALCGNDDDHPRNHAAIYDPEAHRWRLAPAFDVVPNPDTTPTHLAMGLSLNSSQISANNLLQHALQFGFESNAHALKHLHSFVDRVKAGFEATQHLLEHSMAQMMKERLTQTSRALTQKI
ncbi:type II toxin-antitoxin system HipA family toxin [Limnobacter sp.]|uniref:type II toxin-antitoxin system HipA family toxin n=1 Tax=Limnobacter sp. TaxID=2003368 RepID=UPI00351413BE